MELYDAIRKMRELSDRNVPFSFTFMSCNLSEKRSDGIVEVHRARFLSREIEEKHKNAEFVERYMNLDTMEVRHFYQPLLMTFNGEKITV